MKKIIDYELLRANEENVLNERVECWLRKGYQPWGSPAVACSGPFKYEYVQAMVMYEE